MKIYRSEEYLKKNLERKTYWQIAEELGVDHSTIQRYLRRYSLTKKRNSWSNEEIKLLKKNYEIDPNIYSLFPDRTVSSINHKASRLGLKKIVRERKYTLNQSFFKTWTPEMAYVFGLFLSDGNVSKNKSNISIHLNSKDHYLLERVMKLMGSNRPVSKYGASSYLRIQSIILAHDLVGLGCVPKKSHIVVFPELKMKYLSHFIRGYFDGDGSIHFNKPNTIKVTFVGTKKFLETLQQKLWWILRVKKGPVHKSSGIYRCGYYGDNARKICEWMYYEAKGLYLKRKRRRYEQHLQNRK